MNQTIRVAACHASPVVLSAADTTDKCIRLIHEAANNGANLVVFPETYIPAFPVWSSMLPPTENHGFFARMAQESIYVDGDEVQAIRNAAREKAISVSIGISEKVRYSSATLFNTNLIIAEDGRLLVHHRKLMPTFFEKLTWSPGDGHGLRVVDVARGCKLGALICGENTNPLARYTLMAQGEQLHVSSWPPMWPTRDPTSSASTGERNYDNVTANRTRAAAHCFEAKCFGVLCAGFLDDAAVEAIVSLSSDQDLVRNIIRHSPRGASMFLDPTGALITGFTSQDGEKEKEKDYLQAEEGILYADLDLAKCVEGKQYHDVVGGYQRLDVFDLKVDRTRREPVTLQD
ncbi:aliphatic nitrilase [Diplodia corticola]|uniref:Aliphatic nitrilase n=1 Tax=Diplodia corticola TaxID=236234 RepID=A0A1J9R8P6_9PEZI|nr:aliphatic nitrilase [Diplodia corticola]OJD36546.1 aliphatic nitrilase [Diplodia corticola]